MSVPSAPTPLLRRVAPPQGAPWQAIAVVSCAVQAVMMSAVVFLDVMHLISGEVINAGRVGVMALVVLCGVAWVAVVGVGVWRLRRACLVPGLVWCVLWVPVAWQLASEAQQWFLASVILAMVGALAVSLVALARLGVWADVRGTHPDTVW